MTTTEKNKLIAEFMGFKSTNNCVRCGETGKYFDFHYKKGFSCIKEEKIQVESEWGWGLVEQDFLFAEDLKFHTSWDWFMPVWFKFKNLNIDNLVYVSKKAAIKIAITEFETPEKAFDILADAIMWYNAAKKD